MLLEFVIRHHKFTRLLHAAKLAKIFDIAFRLNMGNSRLLVCLQLRILVNGGQLIGAARNKRTLNQVHRNGDVDGAIGKRVSVFCGFEEVGELAAVLLIR